ncbi:MAG: hypothetical protein WCL07_01145 [bacterium]
MATTHYNLLTSKLLFGFGATIVCVGLSIIHPTHLVEGTNLTSVTDTLQSSRLSVAARVNATGTTVGSSSVLIKTSSSTPFFSTTTANLKVGDSLVIGTGTYTVVGINAVDKFSVSPVLASGDADDNDPIYLKSKPQHVVSFKTASAVPNGSFRILLPADPTTPNNGDPDPDGFDFNTTVDVTAVDLTGYTFGSGVATATGVGCTTLANYHCFDIPYTGSGAVSATIVIKIGNTNGTNTPIAPAPSNTTLGIAETYPFIVKNFDGTLPESSTSIDSTAGRIAFLEGVRVTATVDPIISMTICGDIDCVVQDVNPGDVVDSETLSNNTGGTSSSTSVSLGGLDLAYPRLQAQKISIATNASQGYVLTALDDGDMRKGTDTINDIVTPPTAPVLLNTVGTEEYGLHPSGSHVDSVTWGTGGAALNKYSGTDTATPLTLASYITGPTALTNTYVIYKANISEVTAQGDYEHSIFYTATSTF